MTPAEECEPSRRKDDDARGRNPPAERRRSFGTADLEFLARRGAPAVRAFLFRMVGRVEDAEDLTQETFLRAFRGLEGFRGGTSLQSWVFRIAANLARDHLRRRGRAPGMERLGERGVDTLPDPRGGDPLLRVVAREGEAALQAALERLPFVQRAALLLKVLEGLRYKEIARILDSTPGSVKSGIHLARKRLALLMEEGAERRS